jgi:3-hydroxy-3-methylglutaryl CoA synthase
MFKDVGLLAFGAYIPRSRLQRSAIFSANSWFAPELQLAAHGERSAANWDEDTITMAVEAARDALTGFDRASVSAISLASTTLPFADRLNSGIVKEALNLPDSLTSIDSSGSQRAGTAALIQALHGVGKATHLCIASERRIARPASEAELKNGDAAAALLIGRGEQVIARYIGSHSVTIDFVDHFRAADQQFDYTWESRWIRDEGYNKIAGESLRDALSQIGLKAEEIDRAVIAITAPSIAKSLAKRAGIRPEAVADTLISNVGDSGVAHPFLMLADALEAAKPGQIILLAAFGQGLDVLAFETTPALSSLPPRSGVSGCLDRRKADSNYMRFLFHRGLIDLERGMRAEGDQKQPGSTLYRNRKTVLALIGGRCTRTGSVQFPKSEISVNPNDHALHTQVDHPLADRLAKIVSYTADNLTYSPAPPAYFGAIDFEGGGRMMAEFTDIDPEQIDVGRDVRMVFRIKATDELRRFKRYFWKATSAD